MTGLRCLLIGVSGDTRAHLFDDALRRAGHPSAHMIDYPDWLKYDRTDRLHAMSRADCIRIESPGRDETTLRAIREWSDETSIRHRRRAVVGDTAALLEPPFPKGCIHRPDEFVMGFRRVMQQISDDAEHGEVFLNHPDEIVIACDKPRAVSHLAAHGIRVPQPIAELSGVGAGYEAVRDAMVATGRSRVFIKLRGGSAGSGVVAYQRSSTRELAISTVAMEDGPVGTVLRNSRKLCRYATTRDIRRLLDTLCPLGVYVEAWIPKAGVCNLRADLRVVTIAGRVRHAVLRLSRHPITNLHLLNKRCGTDVLRERMQTSDWEALIDTCEKVAACLPRMLYLGIDLAVHTDLRGHTVFEVNAFGDLLHGVRHQGENTYEAEVAALASWRARHA
ncbi:MAG: STM4014 family protein [Planctomycetota bacterium]